MERCRTATDGTVKLASHYNAIEVRPPAPSLGEAVAYIWIFLAPKTKARRLHSTLSEHQIKNGAIIIVTRIMIGNANQTMRRNPSS